MRCGGVATPALGIETGNQQLTRAMTIRPEKADGVDAAAKEAMIDFL